MRRKGFILISLFIVFMFVLLVVALGHDKSDNSDIYVKFEPSSDVKVSNKMLFTDEVGKKISIESLEFESVGFVEIDIQSLVAMKRKFSIYFDKSKDSDFKAENFVKVYVTDEDGNNLLNTSSGISTYDLFERVGDGDSRKIYTGKLKKYEKKKIYVKMWIADTYQLTANINDFVGNVRIKVE